jgi:ketosteroid isomerase-like protein
MLRSACRRAGLVALLGMILLGGCSSPPRRPADVAALRAAVAANERAFAHTMAARDFKGFADFIAGDAVFIEDPQPLRGRAEVLAGWQALFAKPAAPFSWEPQRVEVLASGRLALTTGPVRDPQGKLLGTFTSVWRLERPGVWRIVFDRGNPACGSAAH